DYFFFEESNNTEFTWIVGSVEVKNNSIEPMMIGFHSINLWQDSSWFGCADGFYGRLRAGAIIASGDDMSFPICWRFVSNDDSIVPEKLRFEYDCEDLTPSDMPKNYWMYSSLPSQSFPYFQTSFE
ncbi:MAG: hypothetical protein PF588_03995, partial [Candidatus Kapabacteria bacterium]|nr:hypothetical protein [Candidatus Kapabacteria bacterium]